MEEHENIVGVPFVPRNGLNTIEMSPNEQIYACKICNNSFTSPIQLTIHYVTCHRLLPCIKCLLLFLNRNDLDEHNKHQHANDDTNCSQCALKFESKRELVDHLYDIHQKKYCLMCSALVKSSAVNTLLRHVDQVHKVVRQSCRKVFSFDSLAANDTFECLICRQHYPIQRFFTHSLSFHKFSLGYIFTNVLDKRHTSPVLMAVENAENSNDFETKKLCTICKYKFTPLAPKIMHNIYCIGLSVCRKCYDRFDDDVALDAHASLCSAGNSNKADRCKFCAADVTDDHDHLSQVHCIVGAIYTEKIDVFLSVEQTSWIATNYLCNFCGENLSSVVHNINSLIKHYVMHHKFSQNFILGFLKKSVVSLERAETNDKRRMLRFQAVDTVDKDGSDGGVVFDFDSKMVNVIYSSATDSDSSDEEDSRPTRPVYTCTFCPFKTAVKNMLAMHLNQKHGFTPKIEDFRCNACKKIFNTHLNLQRHYKNVHHKNNANYYKCPFCHFSMKGKQKMRSHIALHIESSYHPCLVKQIGFNCKYCHHSFWVIEKLNEHMFNRHPEKFEHNFLMCSICGATFINKTCLRQHRDIKHPTGNRFTSFLYQCKICCTAHIDIDEIRTHMRETHPGIKSAYCAAPHCLQYVTENESFEEHLARFHRRKLFKCLECPKIFETKVYVAKHYEESHFNAKRLKQ